MTTVRDATTTSPTEAEAIPVLIVGGGLVGLSTALFLAHHGVRPLLVERHPDLLIHPRARGFTHRTVELFRQVGLEPAIRQVSYAGGEDFRWVAVRAETLAGEHEPADEGEEGEAMASLSPAPFAPIDQDKLEVLLRAKAEALGADIRFATEMISFAQDNDGVSAVLKDRRTGTEQTVRASYLVAADGWDSPIRRRLGIELDGPGPFFDVATMLADADLRPALRGRPLNIAYLEQPRPGTILMAHDETGTRWVFGIGFSPQYGESLATFTEERCAELFRAAAGLPDAEASFRPQIPGTDLKVLGFAIGAQVAQRYRDGRVFLAGDAAHIVPPTGGLGANTGIQDAHNLAWKLAAVVRGEAGPALLETYHDERRPVGLLTMEQALARWGSRVGEGTDGEAPPLLDYASVAFGYRYRSAAIAGAPADEQAALPPAELTGQPGTRAPHVWLERDGERISTIDLFGRRFVILASGDGAAAWLDAAVSLATVVDAYRVGDGGTLADPEGRWPAAYGLPAGGAVLVRPDGFVAWRADHLPDDPARALAAALSAVLARPLTPPPAATAAGGDWDQSGPRGTATRGRLAFEPGASRLTITGNPKLSDLWRARFDGEAPRVEPRADGVTFHYPRHSILAWVNDLISVAAPAATIELSGQVPWQIEVAGGVSRLNANLSDLRVETVRIEGGASDAEIVLSQPVGVVPIRIDGGASRVRIMRPSGVAVQLRVGGGATSLRFDGQQTGAIGGASSWRSPGADGAPDRYEIEVSGGASDLIVDVRSLDCSRPQA